MIGGHVAGPAIIGRSRGVVVALRQILAYPIGVEIDVEAHASASAAGTPSASAWISGHEEPRFRLLFGDGTDVLQDDDSGLRSGRGPMLVITTAERSSNDSDGREDVRLSLWLWPLPPPGPLILTCLWPRRGLATADFTLDGDAIRAAADHAQPLWPEAS